MPTLERAFQIVFTAVIEHGAVLLPLVFLACLGATVWIARRGGGGWRPRRPASPPPHRRALVRGLLRGGRAVPVISAPDAG